METGLSIFLSDKHPASFTHLCQETHLRINAVSISGSSYKHSKNIIEISYYKFSKQKMRSNCMFSSKPNNLQKT